MIYAVDTSNMVSTCTKYCTLSITILDDLWLQFHVRSRPTAEFL